MKLDRNTNRGGRGKYALVNMRKLIPIIDSPNPTNDEMLVCKAFDLLLQRGHITLGNEAPGDQFFVMKYKDKFTADGLRAYASAVRAESVNTQSHDLKEFAEQMFQEAERAMELGNRIPD